MYIKRTNVCSVIVFIFLHVSSARQVRYVKSCHGENRASTQLSMSILHEWSPPNNRGRLFCAAMCSQLRICSMFEFDNHTCSLHSSGTECVKSGTSNDFFRCGKFQREDGLLDGYVYLGSTSIEVKHHVTAQNWSEALRVCEEEGGTLFKPSPRNVSKLFEKTFYNSSVGTGPTSRMWIGLRDKFGNNAWTWTDQTDQTDIQSWTNWSPYEPNNQNEACVATQAIAVLGMKWIDMDCGRKYRFVCSRSRRL